MNKYVKRFDELGLKYDPAMRNATDAEIEACYNGCGAEWMSACSRKFLDQFMQLYRDCVAVHDWDFEHSDGTKKSFKLANNRFKNNMKKVRDYYFPWSQPSKYAECLKWYLKARTAYRLLQFGGWKAWQDAHDKKAFTNILD